MRATTTLEVTPAASSFYKPRLRWAKRKQLTLVYQDWGRQSTLLFPRLPSWILGRKEEGMRNGNEGKGKEVNGTYENGGKEKAKGRKRAEAGGRILYCFLLFYWSWLYGHTSTDFGSRNRSKVPVRKIFRRRPYVARPVDDGEDLIASPRNVTLETDAERRRRKGAVAATDAACDDDSDGRNATLSEDAVYDAAEARIN